MSKAFLIDINKCSGCRNCQIACKDEHCEQSWLPYAEAQPLTGSFWCRVDEKERGQVPVVKVTYTPILCNHCEKCSVLEIAGDAAYRRDDGLVIIDPIKAKGRRDLVAACPLGSVYWNDDLELPQKCTGCAHLLDDGWTVPRCVDACAHDAIRFAEEDELDLDGTEFLEPVAHLAPKVYYRNLPKRFAAGCVFDPTSNEVVIGAKVSLLDAGGVEVGSQTTDDFGDWKFDQIEPASYMIRIEADGFEDLEFTVDVTEKDIFSGDRPMVRI